MILMIGLTQFSYSLSLEGEGENLQLRKSYYDYKITLLSLPKHSEAEILFIISSQNRSYALEGYPLSLRERVRVRAFSPTA